MFASACLRYLTGALRRGRHALLLIEGTQEERAAREASFAHRERAFNITQSLAKDPASVERANIMDAHGKPCAVARFLRANPQGYARSIFLHQVHT